jgi:hypothetical protein
VLETGKEIIFVGGFWVTGVETRKNMIPTIIITVSRNIVVNFKNHALFIWELYLTKYPEIVDL